MLLALYMLYTLAIIVPSMALKVRRLHDIGLSGWYYVLFVVVLRLLPFVVGFWGSVAVVVMACIDSKPEVNKWGESPKYVSEAEA